MTTIDLSGAADLHCHFGPDAHRERSVDALEAAREAAAAGHAALVLKSHDYPTAALARIVGQVVPGIRVFGGISCDREVGGVNPSAVETALRLGAKVVWLPTLSSRQDFEIGVAARLGIPGPGLRVVDDSGRLLPETHEVMRLVEESGAILATGHVSRAEHFAVARKFRGKLLVTHAMEELAGPNLAIADCVALADLGATIELCALTSIGALATRPVSDLAACIRTVGPRRVTLASDYGQKVNPHPAEGLRIFAAALHEAGVSERDIRQMACDNPCRLLGLSR
ncbi:MAG: DUF6282 family protein [Candidatus Binatia bacterium]